MLNRSDESNILISFMNLLGIQSFTIKYNATYRVFI